MLIRIFFILFIIIPAFTVNSYSEEKEWGGVLSTKFATIFYEEAVDLKMVNANLNLRFSDFYSPRAFKEEINLAIEGIISRKIDAIFNRAEEILDMYPNKMHIAINIYKHKEGLDAAYEGFFNEKNTAVSFYIYNTNTIYTIESAINEKILTHEIAHSIIDHYFVILPPRKIQEMLAVYADVHLKD